MVGLKIEAERLAEIRSLRIKAMGGSRGGYARLAEIHEELDLAAAIHRRLRCTVLDVTNLAIEEAAQRVVRLIDQVGTRATRSRGAGFDPATD